MEPDPIGLEGGLNPYAYAGSNPVMNIDPSGLFYSGGGMIPLSDDQLSRGLDQSLNLFNNMQFFFDRAATNFISSSYSNYLAYADVSVRGNNVSITLPMKYTGTGASASTTSGWNGAIERAWSGKFGSYDVTTTVVDGSNLNGSKVNTISVPDGKARPYVLGVGGNTGVWPSGSVGWQAAHEAGHLMGLPDQYKDNNAGYSVPNAGYQKNIMAVPKGTVSPQDIKNVINANKSPFCRVFGC